MGGDVFQFLALFGLGPEDAGPRLGQTTCGREDRFRQTEGVVGLPGTQSLAQAADVGADTHDVVVETGEVQTRHDRGLLGAVGELAARMRREQARERIDRVLPAGGGARPVGLRFSGGGGGLMLADFFPDEAGHRGLAADGQLFGPAEGGVTHVAITREEFVLGVEGRRETFRGLGVTAGGEGLLRLGFQCASLLPERRGFKTTEAGVQQGAATGVGEAGELPAVGDLLLAGDREAELLGGRGFVVLGEGERRGLERDRLLAQPFAPEEVQPATQGDQPRVFGADRAAGRKIFLVGQQGLFQQADIVLGELEALLADFLEGRFRRERTLPEGLGVRGGHRELGAAGRPALRRVEQQGGDGQGGDHQQQQGQTHPGPDGLE